MAYLTIGPPGWLGRAWLGSGKPIELIPGCRFGVPLSGKPMPAAGSTEAAIGAMVCLQACDIGQQASG